VSFGEWVFARVASDATLAELPFARLEQLCSNAGSLICGAAYSRPDVFRGWLTMAPDVQREAALLSRRTADGFRASLADRNHVVLAWPWDHLATRVAWRATQGGQLAPANIGEQLLAVGGTYALMHREQFGAVVTLWAQVAAGVAVGAAPDLAALGAQMLDAHLAEVAAAAPGR
jgi:hypothetical protein